ncbi:hypothetical protein FQR65_LT00752 [Abscondita terminalis]|nr:hypothetical protein FQR65_LT00752 [Abscondita terminalis]
MSALQEQNRGEDFFHFEKLGLKFVGVWRTKDDSIGYKIYSSVVIAIFTCAYYMLLSFGVFTQNLYDGINNWVVFIGFTIAVFVNLSWILNVNNLGNLLQKMGKNNFVRNFYRIGSFEHSAISKWYRYKNIYSATYVTAIIISILLQFIYTLTLRYTKTDPNEWKCWHTSGRQRKLINFVNNHMIVLKLTDEVSEIYSKTILTTFVGVMSSTCLEIYQISVLPTKDLSSVTVFLEVLSALFAIFLICAAANNINNESIRLAKAVYEVNFVGTSTSFQKSLMIILGQAQKPIEIKSGRIMNISFITFTAVPSGALVSNVQKCELSKRQPMSYSRWLDLLTDSTLRDDRGSILPQYAFLYEENFDDCDKDPDFERSSSENESEESNSKTTNIVKKKTQKVLRNIVLNIDHVTGFAEEIELAEAVTNLEQSEDGGGEAENQNKHAQQLTKVVIRKNICENNEVDIPGKTGQSQPNGK